MAEELNMEYIFHATSLDHAKGIIVKPYPVQLPAKCNMM